MRNLVFTLGEEYRLKFSRTECWGRYLDLNGRKTDRGENCIMMNFTACILHRILLGWLNQGAWGGRDMWHAWGTGEMFIGFWLGGHWEDLRVGGVITLSLTLGRYESMGRTVFTWLRLGSGGGLLWTRWWIFGFHKESRLLFDKLSDNQLFK
jgi:hypothetical protein